MRVLLLEDDEKIAAFVQQSLEGEGHCVDVFASGADAMAASVTQPYDFAIIDRMVPELDGLSVLKAIRATGNGLPIILLTAMGEVDHRVEGLEAGADDYLVKPFALSELTARMAAIGRRGNSDAPDKKTVLSGGGILLDRLAQKCTRHGHVVHLSSIEFRLLDVLMRNAGRVLTRNMLIERVWNLDSDPTTSVVETHMSRLRSKIEKPFGDTVITTLRGSGYRFDA